jgi:MFS family permease
MLRMNLFSRLLPPDTPPTARHTLRHDTFSRTAKGLAAVGGAATAAVVAKKAFGADDFVVAVLYSAGHVGLIAGVWTPRLIARYRTIPLIFAVEMVAAALIAVSGFMTTSWAFVLALSCAYAVGQCLHPAYSRVYRQNYPTAIRGRLFALVRIGMNTSTALGGYVAGRLLDVEPASYTWIYPLLGVAGAIGALAFRGIRLRGEAEMSDEAPPDPIRAYKDILTHDRRYVLLLITWAFFGFSNMMTEPVRAIYLTDPRFAINASYLESLLVLLIIPQAAVMLTLPVWGRLVDKYPVTVIRPWQQIFSVLSLVIFIATPRLEWLYFASLLRGVQMAGGQMTWPLAMLEYAPRNRVSEYTAIHTLFTGARGLAAPQVAALLVVLIAPQGAFAVGAMGCVLSIVLFFLYPRLTASWPVPEGAPPPRTRALPNEATVSAS